MNKKIMAVTVAGVLAAPGLAFAQSNVTISGKFHTGIDNFKVTSPNGVTHTGATKNSENRVFDNSSRIRFGMTEDLGGGLSAVAVMEMRFNPDQAAPNTTSASQIGTGDTWVGLNNKTMGRVVLGRKNVHYVLPKTYGGFIYSKAGSYAGSIAGLTHYINTTSIAVGRTQNIIVYDSPTWGGFAITAAYSMNRENVEADSTSTTRAGRAWNVNPSFVMSNWGIEYSHWDSKPDAPGATTNDQKGDKIGSVFTMSGFRVGLFWDKSKLNNSRTGVEAANRVAWGLPLAYSTGAHTVYFEYGKAQDNKTTAVKDGAKMTSIGYNYGLSKRTNVAMVYAKINNDPGAFYQLYSTTGSNGNAASTLGAGEGGRVIALTIRHDF